MTRIKIVLTLLLIGILSAVSISGLEQVLKNQQSGTPDVFVGIDLAYDGVEDVRALIDRVKDYTNLIVVGSFDITFNETKLDATCQYIYENGLYFFVYLHPRARGQFNQTRWLERARDEFGSRFLGIYAFDEIGGHQVDRGRWMLVNETNVAEETIKTRNYTDVADKYLARLDGYLKEYYESTQPYYMHRGNLSIITADYALYWFTYNSLCDVVLGEYAWNLSRPLQTALVRGAATAHNKEWGVMLTWTYYNSPYMESADELYDDMVLAYLNGAKYIVVFNYPKVSDYGVLTEEHFDALKRFWQYVNSNPRKVDVTKQRVTYVLPKDYGWGFRRPDDNIWGLWEPDKLSEKIWNDINRLLNESGLHLDIVYDDPKYWENVKLNYGQIIFWNQTEF